MNTRKHIALIAHNNRKHDRATADFLVSSPLMREEYRRLTMGIEDQLVRWVQPVPLERPQSDPLPTELLMPEPRQIS